MGNFPEGVGVNPNTNRVYVPHESSDNVSVIDGATNQVIATVSVGSGPHSIGVNPSTNRVYVANSGSNSVSVIDDTPLIAVTPTPTSTPAPKSSPTPAATATSTPTPSPTPTPMPTVTPTPEDQVVTTVTVEPTTAKTFNKFKDATVTVLDQDNEPIKGVTVEANVSATRGKPVVKPKSVKTDEDGEAGFQFKFPKGTSGGKITFTADGKTATITQK